MFDPSHPVAQIFRQDRRYKFEAYLFVFEALDYAQNVLGMGGQPPAELLEDDESESDSPREERHLSGQQLCEAIRQYALQQYGFMAKCVLNNWGVHSTGDFGEIVFNLIRIQRMRKTRQDRREDFDNVFDFDAGLTKAFKITLPDSSKS